MALMPRIMYGTAWKKEATADLVSRAVEAGFRGIDTACQPKHYNEPLVGKALASLYERNVIQRSDIFLQTKFTTPEGHDRSKPMPYDPELPLADQIKQSFQTSLVNLNTTYLDSYVLHAPMRTLQETITAWKTLLELAKGNTVIKMIGISNCYDVQMLETLHEIAPVQVVQNRWYQGNDWDHDVVGFCRKENIQYQSFWTLSGSPKLLLHPVTEKLARKKGCTEAQIVYALAQSGGIIPLAGSKDPVHMKDGLDVEGLTFSEPDEEKLLEELKDVVHLK